MNSLVLVLRFLHILAGVFWAGASLMLAFFIGPTIRATEQSGQIFARHLILKTRFNAAITSSAIVTILAGIVLYWLDSDGLTSAWMRTGPGIAFGTGAFFGFVGFVFGAMIGQSNTALAKLGEALKGPPTPEQLGQIQAIQKKLAWTGQVQLIAMLLAVTLMATARYFF
ncbi:MAG: hypothetical protein AB1846_03615 [Chloroflexota bacterium]